MTLKGSTSLKSDLRLLWQKNIKRKDLVFALLNREIIEAMWGQLIGSNGSE